MAEGASLQNYNNELVNCIEEVRSPWPAFFAASLRPVACTQHEFRLATDAATPSVAHRYHSFGRSVRSSTNLSQLTRRRRVRRRRSCRMPPLLWHRSTTSLTPCMCSRIPSLVPAAKIQNDLRILTERLARINDNLARKVSSRTEYDKTITETEAAYSKIMESSQTLLHVLKRESVNLTKKKQASA